MFDIKDVEIKNIDHLGIVAGIIDSIGLVEIINEYIGVNELKGRQYSLKPLIWKPCNIL